MKKENKLLVTKVVYWVLHYIIWDKGINTIHYVHLVFQYYQFSNSFLKADKSQYTKIII